MKTRPTRNFAPDGFTASRSLREGRDLFAAVAAAASGTLATESEPVSDTPHRRSTDDAQSQTNDDYDAGLVHSHNWASSDR